MRGVRGGGGGQGASRRRRAGRHHGPTRGAGQGALPVRRPPQLPVLLVLLAGRKPTSKPALLGL